MHYTINSALLQLLSIKNLSCCWFTKRGRKKLIPIHQYSTYNTTGCCIGKRGFSNTPFTVYVKYIHTCSTSPLHNFLPYHSWIDSMLLSRLENIETLQIHAKGQLISKCPFGVIVWTKIPMIFFSRISSLTSKKRSKLKNKGSLYR